MKFAVIIGMVLILSITACGASNQQAVPVASSAPTTTMAPLAATITPTASAFPTLAITPLATTSAGITIDGQPGDWEMYPIMVSDLPGDQLPGSSDLGDAKAIQDDQYLYIMVRFYDRAQIDHYEIVLMVDRKEKFKVWAYPNNYKVQVARAPFLERETFTNATVVQGDVVEIAIPQPAFQNQKISGFSFRIWNQKEEADRVESAQVTSLGNFQPAATPVPLNSRTNPLADAVAFDVNHIARVVYTTKVAPYVVRVDPTGNVLMLDVHDDTIYQISKDGELLAYASFFGRSLDDFRFDPDGNLWFSTTDGSLFQVGVDGKDNKIASHVYRQFDFDPQGEIYAIEYAGDGIQKISKDGRAKIVSSGFTPFAFDVGPNGEIVATDVNGQLLQIFADGTWKVVASGFGIESTPSVAADGMVYILDWISLDQVNLQSGTKTHIGWYDQYVGLGDHGILDQQGRLIAYHPNEPVVRIDLKTRSVELLYLPRGNTRAMSVSTQGKIYVAYGNKFPSGETRIYQVIDQTTIKEVGRVSFGTPMSMAFAQDGTGYLVVTDRVKGSAILTFDPNSGDVKEYTKTNCQPFSVAVDPVNGTVAWDDCETIFLKDGSGQTKKVSTLPNVIDSFIAFDKDGGLYATFTFRSPEPAVPSKQAFYKLQADEQWVEIANLTTSNPYITFSRATICPDNTIYAIHHTPGRDLQTNKQVGPDTMANTVYLLQEGFAPTPLITNLSNDPFSVTCNQENHLFFTTIAGIVEFYPK